ncbi:MAG TPA: hypothetical protein DDY13_10405 [Cytophagales bacterium]|jgi:uncharacterized membrane protein YhhN|nr:hypothetical protein [Cytophagales bacterium]
MNIKNILLYLYLVVLAADLLVIHFNWFNGEVVFKSALMPVLAGYYLIISKNKKIRSFRLFGIALILAWLGDVFLLFSPLNDMYFILGMCAFLIMQLIYAYCFHLLRTDNSTLLNNRFIHTRMVMVALALGAFYYVIAPQMGNLKLPVGLYVCAIAIMVIYAIKRRGNTTEKSFTLVYGGALIFMVSDGMIAVVKFMEDFNHSRVLIMLTYGIAQLLIVRGVYLHQKAYHTSK